MENIEVKELTAEDVKTVEIVAASMNQIVRKYNALLANTVELKDFKQFQAEIILASREVASTLDKGGEEMGKLKKAFDGLMDVIKIQGDSITTLKTAFDPKISRKSFRDAVDEQLQKGAFKDIAEGKTSKGRMVIETKDVAFGATVGGYGSGDAQHAVMPFQVPQMPPLESADVRLVVPYGTIDSDKLDFPQERAASLTDAMATKAENAAAAESSFGFTMTTVVAHRFTAFVEISRAALKNTGWLSQYISNRLMAQFVKKLNTNVIAGTGAGTDIIGLVASANTFLAGAGSFAGKAKNANEMDVLNFAAGEMEELYFLSPDTALLNPVDCRVLASTKNTIADFINPATFLQRDSLGYTTIFGMTPKKFADIVKDTYLVGNMNPAYMQLLFNGPIEILATDSHASNFINDLIVLKLEASAMLPIYNANALMKGTLSTDLIAITKL
jgi:HK97 family phage major capsid protein